jgi:phosphoribosylformimino-5-aminoimidazole carboxamide ribotide isomerase
MPLRVIPVLDVKAGRAVRAIGGNRDHYHPLRTRLHADSDPLGIARAYRDVLNCGEVYVADLDAIAGAAPGAALYRAIGTLGLDLWVDAGLRNRIGLAPLLAAGVSSVVIGLETVGGPEALAGIIAELPPPQLVFSLDLRAGLPLIGGDPAEWGTSDAFSVACRAVALGLRRVLLLDLARVGRGGGTGTMTLLRRLRAEYPDLEISVGGGVADRAELRTLTQAGADAVLIGSAFHDGRLGVADLL